jgi:hypothetical protein
VESPLYETVTVSVPTGAAPDEQEVAPNTSAWLHNVVPSMLNVTVPVGVAADPLRVAE